MGLLFELFYGTFVDAAAFVDQVTGRSGFARIDVANNDDVDVNLFFTHIEGMLKSLESKEKSCSNFVQQINILKIANVAAVNANL